MGQYLKVYKYQAEDVKWIKQNLLNKTKLLARIKDFQPYGAFVTLKDGVDALLPLKNISVTRLKSPDEMLKKGEEIEVLITEYNEDTGYITVSHKEFLGTWEENVAKFNVGDTVKGRIRGTTRGGVFIELMPNLVGLAEHKSGLMYGEEVDVLIKKISPENHKIKLVILD